MAFAANFDFENQFILGNGEVNVKDGATLFSDDMQKRLKRIRIENCEFDSQYQFTCFLSTLKDQIDLLNCFNDGTLVALTIKNLWIRGQNN